MKAQYARTPTPRAPATTVRRGAASVIPIERHPRYQPAAGRHRATRYTLIGLALFLGGAAISGGLFVVPDMPLAYLTGTPFTSYFVPAVVLTLIGVSALQAAVLLARRQKRGAAMATLTGLALVVFEIVQVGFLTLGDWLAVFGIMAGHRVLADGEGLPLPIWLEPLMFGVGLAMAGLGARLWRAEQPRRQRR